MAGLPPPMYNIQLVIAALGRGCGTDVRVVV